MKPSLELTQKLHARSKEAFPSVSASTPAMLTVDQAAQVCQDHIDEIHFEPKGDNHHNAMACPHCRQGNVLVAVSPALLQKFINIKGPWSIEDETKIIAAFKYALDNFA